MNFDTKKRNSLKTQLKSNPVRLIDTAGELSTIFTRSGQDDMYASCGVTFQNVHFIFGGDNKPRQILQVDECGLIKLGSLDFDHHKGACSSTWEVIVLCFNFDKDGTKVDLRRCRKASSSSGTWTETRSSLYDHREASIATSEGDYR